LRLFQRLRFSLESPTGLCRTCSWGTVRKGFRPAEAEVFCRIVGPNVRVGYAVRECTSYADQRALATVSDPRRYGFVTEIKLEDGSEVRLSSEEESD
jgi:hypothetical protein